MIPIVIAEHDHGMAPKHAIVVCELKSRPGAAFTPSIVKKFPETISSVDALGLIVHAHRGRSAGGTALPRNGVAFCWKSW